MTIASRSRSWKPGRPWVRPRCVSSFAALIGRLFLDALHLSEFFEGSISCEFHDPLCLDRLA